MRRRARAGRAWTCRWTGWSASTAAGSPGARPSGVALARLLLREDAVVVLDEPTEHLDAPTADALVEDLLAATAGAAVLVITHDPALVARCDRVVEIGRQPAPVG